MPDPVPSVPAWYHVSWAADLQDLATGAAMGRAVAHVCVRFSLLPPAVGKASESKLTGYVSVAGLGAKMPLLEGTLRTSADAPMRLDAAMQFADDQGRRWRLELAPTSPDVLQLDAADEPAVMRLFEADAAGPTAEGASQLYIRIFLTRMQSAQ